MSDPLRRTETTYVDARTGAARCTVQWLLEKLNLKGKATHPITHNNRLTFFVGGAAGFADIAEQIGKARDTIDIICWGFDPGMELVRSGSRWPRGPTYGDLLIAAGRRGVRVRLLVWHEPMAKGPANQHNMPGHTHDRYSWYDGPLDPEKISAGHSVSMLQDRLRKAAAQGRPPWGPGEREWYLPKNDEEVPLCARQQYCASWYRNAFEGKLAGIQVRTRKGNSGAIDANLVRATEGQRDGARPSGSERMLLVHGGSHHQKPILIDYDYNEGEKAVGYVMGLNSLTDYWDTAEHLLEDPLREQGGKRETEECIQQSADGGFTTFKPLRDYACRIERGGALVALHKNFVAAWEGGSYLTTPAREGKKAGPDDWENAPAVLRRKAVPGDSTAQIVRTCAEDGDTSIRDSYFIATDNATLGAGYIYIENQYFQYEEWSRRLLEKRRYGGQLYSKACAEAGLALRDRPPMHVFIVTPTPEKAAMIPRTYDALATLGQHDGLTGQQKMIDGANERAKAASVPATAKSAPPLRHEVPDVVRHANTIDKPDFARLEREHGIKVCTAMLYTCDCDGRRWRYREIYIHSKLMIVDDLFMTLGSANLNHRSMAVDSEINISINDPWKAKEMRKVVWGQLTGGVIDGGNGTRKELARAFKDWRDQMHQNMRKVLAQGPGRRIDGYILPLEDKRSSTFRLG